MRRGHARAQVPETSLILDPARVDACEYCGGPGVAEVSWNPLSQRFGLTTSCAACVDVAVENAIADTVPDAPIAIEWITDAAELDREVARDD